ncbi:hypothetical protein [Pantoea sp. Nvir]
MSGSVVYQGVAHHFFHQPQRASHLDLFSLRRQPQRFVASQ